MFFCQFYNEMHILPKLLLYEKNLYIIVDESTDACGRYIAHLIIRALKEDRATNSYLIACKQVDKTNLK